MSTQEKYPLYKRIFVNGEWIGSDLFKEHFDLDNKLIIISDILGMTDYLAVNVNTPSTTAGLYTQKVAIDLEKKILLLIGYDDDEPWDGESYHALASFSLDNSLLMINKESENELAIELVQLPAELVSEEDEMPNFPYWWSNTTCIRGITVQRCTFLLNDHIEPMTINPQPFNKDGVNICNTNADYFNLQHKDLRNPEGIVTGKLVIYDNTPYTISGFDKAIIDNLITEVQGVILRDTSHKKKIVPIAKFLDDCQYVSPFNTTPLEDEFTSQSEILPIVTPENVFKYYPTKKGDNLVSFCSIHDGLSSTDTFFSAYNRFSDVLDRHAIDPDYFVAILSICIDRIPKNAIFILPNGAILHANRIDPDNFPGVLQKSYEYYLDKFEEENK